MCSRSLLVRIYSLNPSSHAERFLVPELQRTFKPHTTPVITTAVDNTGTLLATGGADGLVKVRDIKGGYTTHTFRGHSGIISALTFFEVAFGGPQRAASSKARNKNRNKSFNKEAELTLEERESDSDIKKSFRLASGGEDGKVRIWDLHQRKCISVLESHVSVIRGLGYSADANALVSGSRDKTIIVWDARSWKPRVVVPVLEGVESTGFVAGGKLIYTGGEHGKIRLWSVENGREFTQEQPSGTEGESIVDVLYPNGMDWLMSVHGDQSLLVHSLESLSHFSNHDSLPPLPVIRRISGTHDEIIDLAYLKRDKSWLALATNSEDIRIVSVSSSADSALTEQNGSSGISYFGADVALLKGHEDIVICLDVDWSGHWLATGAKDNTARLWCLEQDSSTFTCFAVFTGHAESLGAIALPKLRPPGDAAEGSSLDHRPAFVLTGSQDQTIKCWNVPPAQSPKAHPKTSAARYTRKAHDKDINAIAVNHNSTLFASASQDRTVKVWSVEEGEVQGILRGHRRGVWSVQFAPKDTPAVTGDSGVASSSRGILLTGSGDKTVKIWSLTDYSCLRTLEGHTNSVLRVVWLPPATDVRGDTQGSPRAASAGGDGLVKVWDVNNAELLCTLDNHTDRVWALTVDQANNSLISGGGDGIITFWKDTTSTTASAAETAASQRIEQDQQLQNFMQARAYREAITLALQLNHPGRLLSLFTAVVNTAPPEPDSLSGLIAVDAVLARLSDDQLLLLLERLRDWNTNARTAPVAQRILYVLVKSYPAARFVDIRTRRPRSTTTTTTAAAATTTATTGGIIDIVDALKAYTERHYKRLDDLLDESYLLEFTLREMG